MNGRAQVLAAIRHGLGRDALDGDQATPLAARLATPTPNRLPAASRGDRMTLLRRFADKMRRVDATLATVTDFAAVPNAVVERFPETGSARVAPHPDLAPLDWGAVGLQATFGPARGDDPLGVSRAHAGVAESGTLVLCSGPNSPTSLNFLPDRHVVVLHADEIVGAYETVWQGLREGATGDGFMPRTVNWITGPSRTADIEQTLYLGIHGPRQLHVLLVGPDLSDLVDGNG